MYDLEDLLKFSDFFNTSPSMATKFSEYFEAVFNTGKLSRKDKALIGLAVAFAAKCPYSISVYTSECLLQGSDTAEMMEAMHVTTFVQGGTSLLHGMIMNKVAQEISTCNE